MRTPKAYWVYILTNATTTVLYVGMTNDLDRRLAEHAARADPAAFTARYRTDRLVYVESFGDVRDAIAREKQLKGWRRAKKRALVNRRDPDWRDLRAGPPVSAPRRRDPAGRAQGAAGAPSPPAAVP